MQLDAVDLRILAELQQDSSLTNVELAKRVHLSPSPCLTRVKALETGGVIDRYVALANPKALGLGLNVFINISLKEQSRKSLAEFERRSLSKIQSRLGRRSDIDCKWPFRDSYSTAGV